MSIINNNSYLQLASELGDASLIRTANILSQKIELMRDAVFVEANEGMSHVGERWTAIPSGQVAGYNQYVPASTADSQYLRENLMQLRDFAKYDTSLLKRVGVGTRKRHDMMHMVGLIQQMAEKLTYGNKGNGFDEIDGLITQYNVPNACDGVYQTDAVAQDGLPTGSGYSSLLLVDWGLDKVYLTYPSGTSLGLTTTDLGDQLMQQWIGGVPYMNNETVTKLEAQFGLFIHDPRSVARVASIATGGGYVSANFQKLEQRIMYAVEVAGMENPVIYTTRTLKSWFRMRANEKSNVYYTPENPWALPRMMFGDIPIRLNDRMLDTEARLQ